LGLQSSTLERLKPGREKIYATTLSKGFYAINTKTMALQLFDRSKGLLSNSVYDVLEEGDTLWVGTLGGITRLHQGKSVSWAMAEGFRGKRALLIFRDRHKRLFVVSENYLHLVQHNKLIALRSFPLNNTAGTYISQAAYDTTLNQLWLVSANGFLKVLPDAIVPDTTFFAPPKLKVLADGSLLQQPNNSYMIGAKVQQLTIVLGKAPVSPYTMPEAYFMLQGYHPNWQPLPGDYSITLPKLPAGNYKLMVKATGPDLGEFPPTAIAVFEVMSPYWQQAWFLAATGIVLAVLAYLAARRYTQLRYRRQLATLKAKQAIEVERWRISRELHDNVGSMLTLMVNRLNDDPIDTPEQQEKLAAIAKTTLAQLRDAIWTLDGKELLLEQWTQRATQYLNQIEMPNLAVNVNFNWPASLKLSPIRALNAFRILQEACTNAIKHAQPTQLKVLGSLSHSTLLLHVEDNGKGIEPEHLTKGYGLVNMEKRAAEMQGTITWQQGRFGGTIVVLQWPVDLAKS
jgi:signal transduction histidine kinase